MVVSNMFYVHPYFGEDEPILTNFLFKDGLVATTNKLACHLSNLQRCLQLTPLGPGGWNLKAMPLEPKWASQMDQAWKSSSEQRPTPRARVADPTNSAVSGRFWWVFWKVWSKRCATFFDTIFWRNFLDGTLFVCFFFPWVSNQPSSTIVSINFSWFESLKFPVMFVAMLVPHF